jgi:hypothetical protein
MGIKLTGAVLIAVTMAEFHAEPARAQGPPAGSETLVAIARRDLTFGTVLPGIPSTVPTDHPRQAGLFEVQGAKGAATRIEFLLPSAMTSMAGQQLPLSFGPGDGSFGFNRGRNQGVPFDPRTPLVAALGPNGKIFLKLGGTVVPSRVQNGGEYAATISMTIFDLGS